MGVDWGTIWLYGSESFRTIRYPSDIDFKQVIKFPTKDKELAIDTFLKSFTQLLKRIKSEKGVYLGDVKVGFDHVFDSINIGQLHNGAITGFNMTDVKRQLTYLYKNKFIEKDEFFKVFKLIKPLMTLADYDELVEELRNLHIIRWKEDELLRGYKILTGDRKYTLREALHDKTMVKIDVYQSYNGKYIEYSNFFILFYEVGKEEYTLINLPTNYFDLIEITLQEEIEKFMFSTNFLKPFKSAKRMFSLARLYKDQDMLERLLPLLNGDCGQLYQIISDFDLIATMLDLKNPPLKELMDQLDKLKYKLPNITKFSIDEEYLTETINSIVDPLDKINQIGTHPGTDHTIKAYLNHFDYIDDAVKQISKPGQIEKVIKILKEIKKDLNEILIGKTIKYFVDHNLYPPPPQYLPNYDKRKYHY